MSSAEQSRDSVKTIARYLGYRQKQLSVKGLIDGALKEFIQQTLGTAALNKIRQLESSFIQPYSPFWTIIRKEIGESAAEKAGEKTKDVSVSLEEFNIHRISSLDTVSIPQRIINDLIKGKPLNLDGLEITLVQIQGDFKIEVEGVVPWPVPDPDLIFEWEVEISLRDFDIWVTFILSFKGVEGPGIGWFLTAIGYFLAGGAIGYGLWAGAAGYGLGEGLDLVYEAAGDKPIVLNELESVYDNTETTITRDIPKITVFRPDRQKSFGLSMKVQHAVSAIKGLLRNL